MGKTVAIITAGGSGTRIRSITRKQFIELKNRPVLFWTLDKFVNHECIDEILVVLPQDNLEFCHELRSEFPQAVINCIAGGKERQDSVYNALLACSDDVEYVMIHDGVRPFIEAHEISALHEIVKQQGAVIAVSRVKNTIKSVTGNEVAETIPRENLYNALTPQVFKLDQILALHKQAREENLHFTDDAAILEHYGQKVRILECSSGNIKITDHQDLELAKILLESK